MAASKRTRSQVSFVILNWRKPDKTSRAIKSIRQQSQAGQTIEIILVDNQSEPKEFQRLKKLADKTITNEANLGFAYACNQGAELAEGEYVAFVNNDAFLPSDWLKFGLKALKMHKKLVAVAGGEKIDGTRSYSLAKVSPYIAMVRQSQKDFPDITESPYIYGSNLLIETAAFRQVGGFEASYFAYYEDVDLGAKLAARGYTAAYVPAMTIDHEVGASTESGNSDFRNRLIQTNKYRYIARQFSNWYFYVLVAALYDCGKFLFGNLVVLFKPQPVSSKRQKRSVYRAQLKSAGWALSNFRTLSDTRVRNQDAGNYSPKLRRQLSDFARKYSL